MVAVDEFEIDDAAPPPRAGAPSSQRRRRPRLPRGPAPWVAAAVALVAVGAATAGPPTLIAGQGSGVELGTSDLDLSQPPDIAWEAPSRPVGLIGQTPDRLLTQEYDTTTGRALPAVTAYDLASGEVVWQKADAGACQLRDEAAVCVREAAQATAVVVEIDADDGAETRHRYPRAVAGYRTPEGLVVVVDVVDDLDEDVVLLADDGSERWRVRLDVADEAHLTYLWEDGGLLGFALNQRWIDLATGELAEPDERAWDVWTGVDELSGGLDGLVAHTAQGDVDLAPDEAVFWLDDDLGGPVALVQHEQQTLLARLRDDGRELWRVDATCSVHARLAGVVVVATGCDADGTNITSPEMVAVDEVTGERLWSAPTWSSPTLGSSAGVLVVQGWEGGALGGVDVRTGETLWTVGAPAFGSTFYASMASMSIEDGWFVSTEDSVHVWAWSGDGDG